MTDTPLLPCPFCGHTDITVSRVKGFQYICCNAASGGCGAGFSPGYGGDLDAAWNRRVVPRITVAALWDALRSPARGTCRHAFYIHEIVAALRSHGVPIDD